MWADGIYCNVRQDIERQCLLVVMVAATGGRKRLLGYLDGFRESELRWRKFLGHLKQRGLETLRN
ncbi:MAG: transposase [bacterium]|nr:transposase [bacterium]